MYFLPPRYRVYISNAWVVFLKKESLTCLLTFHNVNFSRDEKSAISIYDNEVLFANFGRVSQTQRRPGKWAGEIIVRVHKHKCNFCPLTLIIWYKYYKQNKVLSLIGSNFHSFKNGKSRSKPVPEIRPNILTFLIVYSKVITVTKYIHDLIQIPYLPYIT